MTCLSAFVLCFGVLTRRRDFEDGMSEELHFHIEQYVDDLGALRDVTRKSGSSGAHGARQP